MLSGLHHFPVDGHPLGRDFELVATTGVDKMGNMCIGLFILHIVPK
jgi:hypothetical protein